MRNNAFCSATALFQKRKQSVAMISNIEQANEIMNHGKYYVLVRSFATKYYSPTCIPQDLVQMISKFVFDSEKWHTLRNMDDIFASHITITEQFISNTGECSAWIHVFGDTIIQFGDKKAWHLHVTGSAVWPENVMTIIGIMDAKETHKITTNDDFSWSCASALGIDGFNGHKVEGTSCLTSNELYMKPLKWYDVIKMELDMTSSNCTLSYWVNTQSYGIAFDHIDESKQYKLVVAIGDQGTVTLF